MNHHFSIFYICTIHAISQYKDIIILKRVMNAAVRLVAGLESRDHATDSLKALHWLSVQYCIKFKRCVTLHSVANGTSHFYIKDLVTLTSETHGRSHLWSAAKGELQHSEV